jgi:hypothetical protein
VPVVAEFHEKFWSDQSTVVPPPLAASGGGYPVWQRSVIAPSLPLGPLGSWMDAVWLKIVWWVRLFRTLRALSFNQRSDVKALAERLQSGAPAPKPGIVGKEVERSIEKPVEVVKERVIVETSVLDQRIRALDAERRAVLDRSLVLLESTSFTHARDAVRKTATTLGFSRPEAWKDLSREVKSSPGRTENMYRHLKAMHVLRDLDGSTHTNPEQNLLVELAYTGFSVMGR